MAIFNSYMLNYQRVPILLAYQEHLWRLVKDIREVFSKEPVDHTGGHTCDMGGPCFTQSLNISCPRPKVSDSLHRRRTRLLQEHMACTIPKQRKATNTIRNSGEQHNVATNVLHFQETPLELAISRHGIARGGIKFASVYLIV